MNVATDLERLSLYLERKPDAENIQITRKQNEVSFSVLGLTSWFLELSLQQVTPKTTNYFEHVFGKKRVQRVVPSPSRSLTKQQIKELLVTMCELTEEDLRDLFHEIKSKISTVRFLTEDATQDLRKKFQNIDSLENCLDAHLDELYSILVPFRKVEDIFLQHVPSIEALSSDSGKTFFGKRERVYLYEAMRRERLSEEKWMMRFAKRLAAREVPEGVVLPKFQSGYVKVHKVVHAKGAFKYFVKVIGASEHPIRHFIVYRGTRPLPTATDGFETIKEDLRKKLGSEGPKATFDETHALLTNPTFGYVRHPSEPKKAIGMSLGGTHLMYDAVLHDIFDMVTFSSPGVDRDIAIRFRDKVASRDDVRWKITHHFEDKDVMDQFGGVHLGALCDPKKVDVQIKVLTTRPVQTSSIEASLEKIAEQRRKNMFALWQIDFLYKFQQAIFKVHNRETFFVDHQVIELNRNVHFELAEDILSHAHPLFDASWEKLRKRIAIDTLPERIQVVKKGVTSLIRSRL
jgi:hypothetical protein